MKTFVSPHESLTIVLKPTYTERVEGVLVVRGGVRCDFEQGRYATADTWIIERLEKHPDYGRRFFSADQAALVSQPPTFTTQVAGTEKSGDEIPCPYCDFKTGHRLPLGNHIRAKHPAEYETWKAAQSEE